MWVWVCTCAFVCGNDIAVKPDLQSPLPPAYWVVCFAEWLFELGIIEVLLDGQLDPSKYASQYFFGRSCNCVCGPVKRYPETGKKKPIPPKKVFTVFSFKPMWKPNIRDILNLWPHAFLGFSQSSLLLASFPEPLLKLPHLKTISSPKQTGQPVRSLSVCQESFCADIHTVCWAMSHWGA